MDNLTKRIKDEYVIVFAEKFSSGIIYYTYNESDEKMPRHNPYYIAYNQGTKYLSKESAEKKLNELVSKDFFVDSVTNICENVVEDENLVSSIINAYFDRKYNKSKAVAVVKIPNSYYLGKYGAYAYELNKLNIPYDNEHRYQCASNRADENGKYVWHYLKINNDNTTEWVKSQDKATCMTSAEQKKWRDIMNDVKPFKGYVQAMNLPVRLDTPQKYYKGQKVLIRSNGRYYYTHISDVMPQKDGKYYYALPSVSLYGGRISIAHEGFYEGSDLYEEDGIMLFDEVVKSFNVRETKYDTYYNNVVLNDGTKINEIAHF